MTAATLTEDSVVVLHRLHVGAEQDGAVEVGRPETGVFVALPPEGAALVRWLAEPAPLGEHARRFEAEFGAPVDVLDFVRELGGCGFVQTIDGHDLEEGAEPAAAHQPQGWRLLGGLPQRRVAWLLSGPALVGYLAVWLALPALLVLEPGVRPSAADASLGVGVLGDLVLLTVVGWLLVLLHEAAHLVAVRANGCSATLDLSHRLHFLVAQTDMSSVRALPRRARYAPYLAGLTWDATLLVLCLLLRVAGLGGGVPGFLAYLLALSLLFQAAVFLRTDLYYVLTNLLRVGNLMHDTRRWTTNLAARAVGRPAPHDLADVPPRELRVIRWYAVLVVLGGGAVIAQLLLLGLPLLARFVGDAATGLGAGPGAAAFWDGAGLLAVIAAQLALLGVAVVRERRRRGSRSAAEAAGRARVG